MGNRMVQYVLLSLSLFLNLTVVFGSYGGPDMRTVMGWTRDFFVHGFWQAFSGNSTYPHLLNILFYLTASLSRMLGYTAGGIQNVYILKIFAVSGYLGVTIILLLSSVKKNIVAQFIALLFLLNPAIIVNASLLGYTDAFYIFVMMFIVFLITKISAGNNISIYIYVSGVLVAVGAFFKWQFLIYLPFISLALFGISLRKRKVVYLFYGFVTSLLIVLLPLVYGARTERAFLSRVNALRGSFEKIMNEEFVVAEFGNYWLLMNYIRLQRPSSLSDITSSFNRAVPDWVDKTVKDRGQLLFFSVLILFSINLLHMRRHPYVFTAVELADVLLWVSWIYALFNTGVHENHFMPAVALSAFLFVQNPSIGTLTNYVLFSMVNFLNMNYYYGCGLTGLFEKFCHIGPPYVNTPLLIAVFLLLLFVYRFLLLVTSHSGSYDISRSQRT